MTEVQPRPAAPRGRGSGRGGRGGNFATRGGGRAAGSRPAATNGDSKNTQSSLPTFEDEGEVGQLRKDYGDKVQIIKEMFPDWSDVDILFALRETDGDENLTVTRIAEGTISQWGQVSKPKKERKGKADTFTTTTGEPAATGTSRNARGGRGADSGRGRGRATERGGRGAARGKSTPGTTNGTRMKENQPLSVPTAESTEWNAKQTEESAVSSEAALTESLTATVNAPSATIETPKPATIAAGGKTTWASMLRQSATPKPVQKPREPATKSSEPVVQPSSAAEAVNTGPQFPTSGDEPAMVPTNEPAPAADTAAVTQPIAPAIPVVPAVPAVPNVVVPEVALQPSKDQLTEKNLDRVTDVSHPPETETAASEAADSWDPRGAAASATATPLSASQQQHLAARTGATTKPAARTPLHHSRRMLDQAEPVRMPGSLDHVDRASVQFGAFSLNDDEDVDNAEEPPETRPQPPEDSPVTHPRTSLPPVQPTTVPDAFAAQTPVATQVPTGPAAAASAPPNQTTSTSQVSAQPVVSESNQPFGRFGQSAPQEQSSFPTTKPFEPFGQQPAVASAAQNQFEGGFQAQGQAAQAPNQQQPGGPFSSASNDLSSYYTADHQNRFNYYNQNYGQQQGAQGQDALSSQPQRSFSGYNAPQNDSLGQYPQSGAQHGQPRFGSNAGTESQVGGAPTPTQTASQAPSGPSTQAQAHGQQPHDYPYSGHPYYSNPYYSAYMGGYQGYNQGAYGAPYGKGGLGYQPSQYGITPQGPHSYSSPAGAFGQSALHRDSGVGAGLGDYGRAGSTQSAQQGLGSGFGGVHDTFGRSGSAYQSQGGQSFNAPGSQSGAGPSADELKPFGDSKAAGGPSPSLGAAARPGSAANNGPGQAGLPPPQSSQQSGLGMGAYGYPSHMQGHGLHGSQSGAGGYGMGAGGAQSHQNTYGAGYGAQGFGGSYYANAPRGWGNNYH